MQNKKHGFTLLEMSIAMLVIGMVASGYIYYKNLLQQNEAVTTTNLRLQVVQDALTSFIALHGRLPCPASPSQVITDNTFGYEKINTSSQPATCITSGTNITSESLAGDTLYYGTIPIRTLQLSDEYMVDAWDNRIAYIVQECFINNGSSYGSLTVTNPSCTSGNNAEDDQSNNIYFCYRGQASGSVNPSTPDLQIYPSYTALQSGTPMISGNVVYILISAGPDGYGAYYKFSGIGVDEGDSASATATQNPIPTSGANDIYVNAGCDPTTQSCSATTVYNYQFISHGLSNNTSNFYDDIVVYSDRNTLLADCNNYLNNSCTQVLGIEFK